MSNREIQSYPYTMGNQGIVLKSSNDEIPITSYSNMFNAFTDRENTLTVRRGWAKLGSTPSNVNQSGGYLKATAASYRYCVSGTEWCRATIGGAYNSIATGLSGLYPTITNNTLGDNAYIFLADGTKFLKDYGTGSATNVGMDRPLTTLTAVKTSVIGANYQNIEDFSSGIAMWNSSLLSGTGTASQSVCSGYTNNGLTLTASDASSVIRTKRDINLNFGTDDELTIQLYFKWPTDTDSANVDHFILKFSLGDNSFTTTYEKIFKAHPMQSALTSSTYPDLTPDEARSIMNSAVSFEEAQVKILEIRKSRQEAYIQASQYMQADIPVGVGVWNQLRVKKEDFIRTGISLETNPSLTWDNIKSVGIEMVTNSTGGASISIDDLAYRTKGKVTGTNVSYTFTYYDSLTQTESDYADIVDIPIPGANADQFLCTFSDTPPVNATHRRLYRIGGLIEQFQKVYDIPVGTLTYTDDIPNESLGDILNLDNQVAPGAPRGVEAFDNRLFIWGISTDPKNVMRFSKRNKLENFPTDYWIPVGTGNETIVKIAEYDGELYIFTLERVYRLIGTDENSYRVISTSVNIGLASITGLAKGTSALYMSTQDGIYEFPSGKRISESINPLWRGQTVNGIFPFEKQNLKFAALGYFNQRIYFSYGESGGSYWNSLTLVYDLGYERWHLFGYGVTSFFTEPADPDINKEAQLLGGVVAYGNPSHGYFIYALESGCVDESTTGTSGIWWAVTTKDLDLGSPDKEKQMVDLVVDLDTGGSDVLVQYLLDNPSMDNTSHQTTYIPLGTIPGSSSGRQQVILPFPDSAGISLYCRRIVLQIQSTSLVSATLNNQTKIFKIIPRFLIEPPKHKSFITDWSDEGSAGDKIWRELHIDYNSYNASPAIHVEVDGVEVYSFTATASNYRKKFYYSFPVSADLIGTKARIRLDMGDNYIKVYDYSIISIPVANPVTTFETAWSDDGAPNIFKRFRKIVIEVDNVAGGIITVIPEIDGIAQASFNITASGRQEYVYSLPVDTTGYLWRIRASTTTTMRFYSVNVEALQDPTHGTTFEGAWGVEGTANRKRFRDILLDIDTFGASVTATPWIDGIALTPFTITTTTRKTEVLSLPVDTTGILCRLTTSGGSFHTVYNYKFIYSEEPHFSDIKETVWTDEEWPYDKLWKHVTMDIDTAGEDATATFWLDGIADSSWTVNTSSRALLTHSLGQNVIGKLGRITVSGANTQLFGSKFVSDKEPPDVTVADSYEQTFGYDGWKLLKRIYCAIKAPSTVTIQIYADEVLHDTVTVLSNLSSGYAKVRSDLSSNIKGKLFRFVFTSSSAFKLYWEKSQVEMKPMNTDDGWALYKFNPPQSY